MGLLTALARPRAVALGAVLALGSAFAARADFVGHGGPIRAVAVSADGARVLTASFDYSARLWRFDEQRELARLDGHDGPVNDAVFLHDGVHAVTAGADGKVLLWALPEGRLEAELAGHAGRATALAVSADGRLLASGGWDGRVNVTELSGGKTLLEVRTGAPVTGVAFPLGGGTVISGGRRGELEVRRLSDGAVEANIRAHDLGIARLVTSADGRRLLSIGQDDAARVWDLATLKVVDEITPLPRNNPVAAALAPDGATMLLAYLDGQVLELDARQGVAKRDLQAENGPVWALAYSPDGRFALTAGEEERVKVWHLETGDRISVAAEGDDGRAQPWLESDHPGAKLYRKCAGCHALSLDERQRSGPHFGRLFGRRAGTVAGYRYSAALKDSPVVWTKETLTALFREGPDHYLPGTKMPVQRVPDEQQLRDLIDYLELITGRS